MSGEDNVHRGRVVFGAMDEVVFGEPAAEAVAAQMDRLQKSRAFLMVSGTLRRETDAVGKTQRGSANPCPGFFKAIRTIPPGKPVTAPAELARAAHADLIV